MNEPKPPQINATPTAAFANVARMRHTQTEFYLDFGQASLDQAGVANLVSVIVMTPQHTKQLLLALGDNVRRYEARFGEIEAPEPPPPGVVQ